RAHAGRPRRRLRPLARGARLGQCQPPVVREHRDAAGAARRRLDSERHRLGPVGRGDLAAEGDAEPRLPPVGRRAGRRRRLPRPVRQHPRPQDLPVGPRQRDPELLMRALLRLLAVPLMFASALMAGHALRAAEGEKPVERDYSRVTAPPAPAGQTLEQVAAKSDGCYSCHVRTDAPTMHESPAVRLGCTDCHGGDATVFGNSELPHDHPDYVAARERAHVLPQYPESWHYPSSANPERTYALLNREAPEFIRFVNPSDYRIAREACGACHIETIEAAERSIMATGAMLWGGAAYNIGIVPLKNYALGEAYTREGEPAKIVSAGDPPGTVTEAQRARGALAELYPLPTWQVIPPGDVFRVFERGGRNIGSQFA